MTTRLFAGIVLLAAAACGSAPTAAQRTNQHAGVIASPATAASPALGATPNAATSPGQPAPAASPGASPLPNQPPPVAGSTPKASPVPSGTVVMSWNSPKYGQILVDARGHVLYLFTPDDATGTPTCTGSCAAAWPPFKPTSGAPHAMGAVQQSKLGENGGQVTYNSHPLYFYAGDSGPDQTNGQCSGQIWYVLGVDGNPVMTC